jgi:hypothetical protein
MTNNNNIFYTGIGCDASHNHTISRFIEIMKSEFMHKSWKNEILVSSLTKRKHYQLDFGDWNLPDDFVFFTLEDWLEYSGAVVLSEQ